MLNVTRLARIDTPQELAWKGPAVKVDYVFDVTPEHLALCERMKALAAADPGLACFSEFTSVSVAIAYLVDHCHMEWYGQAAIDFFGDQEWVFAASAKAKSGNVYYVLAPGRHHHVQRGILHGYGKEESIGTKQGFMVYKEGIIRHVGREEAMKIARANGQLYRCIGPGNQYNGDDLFSEDLWFNSRV